ncbi:transient receptor potential cation channel subfamily M member 7 [Pelomyxa schiedti]|nr:transient receptor potential cation channel subfamily M member 7 [Pelomyxa schiedti]
MAAHDYRWTSVRENLSNHAVVDLRPFTSGAFRWVGMGTYNEGTRSGQRCVAKWFKEGAVFEEHFYERDILALDEAVSIVQEWNDAHFVNKPILVNRAEVWECYGEREGEKILVEPFIENWEKFNSNTGWSEDGTPWGQVMQALSHFSYHINRGKKLLCDLQGGVYRDAAVISDPVIMSATRSFGVTDLGPQGINDFFVHHECNDYCRPEWWKPRNLREPIRAPVQSTTMAIPTMQSRPPSTYGRY